MKEEVTKERGVERNKLDRKQGDDDDGGGWVGVGRQATTVYNYGVTTTAKRVFFFRYNH